MNDRLAPLRFLPPPINTPWTGAVDQAFQTRIERKDGSQIHFASPLFWHDPRWYAMPIEQADTLAVAIGQLGPIVSAMRSDLAPPDGSPEFHESAAKVDGAGTESTANMVLPRIVPYRPERYGLNVRDFDDAAIIDVRLMMLRDPSGRFAFTPEQIRRWEATPKDQSIAGGGWVPAATFPPDVVSVTHLSRKFDQLRELAPKAAVFATIKPYRIDEELPKVLAAKPDGVILRMDTMELDGLSLAKLVQNARQEMYESASADTPLWIVPGKVSPDDVVKLLHLGATAVAIDAWCDELIAEAEEATADDRQRKFARSVDAIPIDPTYLRDLAHYRLGPKIDRVMGLGYSVGRVAKADRVGSFDAQWVSELGVREI